MFYPPVCFCTYVCMVTLNTNKQNSQKTTIRQPKLPFLDNSNFRGKCAMWIFCFSLYKLNHLRFLTLPSLKCILSQKQEWNHPLTLPFISLLAIQIFKYKLWHTCSKPWFSSLALSGLFLFQIVDLYAMWGCQEITQAFELCILHVMDKTMLKGKVLV